MIIAAVRDDESFEKALRSKVEIIFDLAPDILTLGEKIQEAKKANKKYYVHMDLATGVGRDRSGIQFLKVLGIDGIVSTKNSIIRAAKELELEAVQRFFILDSQSVKTSIEGVKNSKADMVEIMPGIAGRVIGMIKKDMSVRVIAGGLIETKADIEEAMKHGADAVSTGTEALWELTL